MTQFDIEATFISPPNMALTEEFKRELQELNLRFRVMDSIRNAIADADVIYMEPVVQADYTQARVEPSKEKVITPDAYRVTKKLLMEKGKRDVIVLHSLPRMDELPPDVDATRHARYWIEAFNGVVVRMALLALILGAIE
jgi:aspartate carbamoyltransferase catalytic subunit